MTIRFDGRHPYVYHGFTKPECRGRNRHGIGLVRAVELLAVRDCLGVVSLTEWVNLASLGSAHRAGFRPCGFAVRVERGAGVRLWTSPGALGYGISMESRGAPLYRVDG